MLLTITLTEPPATDLGFLLHKHPDRLQSFAVSAGQAHVFYPEAAEQRCTVALLLEIDPITLVRGHRRAGSGSAEAFSLAEYVNDRPYAASSMLAVALGKVFRTAMTGRCDARPDLAARALPLEISIPALPCRGGADLAHRLLRPLGWEVQAQRIPLDPELPEWGDSRYQAVRLTGQVRLADALSHLYVLLPVLDDTKHYWVDAAEIGKLLRAGGDWLAGHPERDLITHRYLAHQRRLTESAVARLAEVDDAEPEDLDNAVPEAPDNAEPGTAVAGTAVTGTVIAGTAVTGTAVTGTGPPRSPLAQQRRDAVLAVLRDTVLRDSAAARVADLGCGEGSLVALLLREPAVARVLGVDVSHRALERTAQRLHLDTMPERQRERVDLLQSSLTYSDARLAGLDAAVLMEVIEHVDPPRLGALEQTVFGAASPGTVVVTTPNAEHNVRYTDLRPGGMRHPDHRFEWTRPEFRDWAAGVAGRRGYQVRFLPVGPDDPEVGPPTQLAVFTRA